MKPEIKEFLTKQCIFKNYEIDEDTLIELVTEGNFVWERIDSSHRWWDEWFIVRRVGDKFLGYIWARANRDESVLDLGWEFDSDSIVEVEPIEKIVIEYEPINE